MDIQKPFKINIDPWNIWCIPDGRVDLDQRLLFNRDHRKLRDELSCLNQDVIDSFLVPTYVNTYLIENGKEAYLVDGGYGKLREDKAGYSIFNLKSIGIEPGDISSVLLTHMHMDHVAGLLSDEGKKVFPKASLFVSSLETAFWTDETNKSLVHEYLHGCFSFSHKLLSAYEYNLFSSN